MFMILFPVEYVTPDGFADWNSEFQDGDCVSDILSAKQLWLKQQWKASILMMV